MFNSIVHALTDREKISTYLRDHPCFLEKMQEILMFKRIPALIVMIATIETILIIYTVLRLNFVSSIFYFGSIYCAFKILSPFVRIPLINLLLSNEVYQGGPNDSNRVKTPNEVACCISSITTPILEFIQKVIHTLSTSGFILQIPFFIALVFLTAITSKINFALILTILTPFILLAPGIIMLPPLYSMIHKTNSAIQLKKDQAKMVFENAKRTVEHIPVVNMHEVHPEESFVKHTTFNPKENFSQPSTTEQTE